MTQKELATAVNAKPSDVSGWFSLVCDGWGCFGTYLGAVRPIEVGTKVR